MGKNTVLMVLLAATAFGQGKLAFEAASLKPAAPIDNAKMLAALQSGGQMPVGPRIGPHRAEYTYMSLKSLIVYAYQVKPYQVSGPDWLDQERFDIVATYPEGATKDDAPVMLQSLLEQRFQLKVHKSTAEQPVLGLVVVKGGPKLKASTEKPAPIDENAPLKPGERKLDGPNGKPMIIRMDPASGGAVVDLGEEGRMTYKFMRTATPPVIHIDFSMVTMAGFAGMMTQLLSQTGGGAARQIVDMTEVKGNYEASIDLSIESMLAMVRNAGVSIPGTGGAPAGDNASLPAASDPGGGLTLTEAVRSMGLRLEPRKAAVEQLVVDHAERKPAGN